MTSTAIHPVYEMTTCPDCGSAIASRHETATAGRWACVAGHSGSVETPEVDDSELFDAILAAEEAVRISMVSIEFQLAGVPDFVRERQHKSLMSAQARLSDLIDGMSSDQAMAFGAYRRSLYAGRGTI